MPDDDRPTVAEAEQTDTGPVAPPSQEDERAATRRRVLSPHLEAFDRWCADEVNGADVPHFVELNGRPIELGSWEREALKDPGAAGDLRRELLSEGVAYQVRCLELNDTFERGPLPPPSELPAFLEDLVTNAAVGKALVEDLQRLVDRMVAEGRLPVAKSLSGFHAKVVRCLNGLAQHLGANQLEKAERLAHELVVVAEPSATPAGPLFLREDAPGAPSWVTYAERGLSLPPWLDEPESESIEQSHVAAESPNRVRKLVLILVGVLVIYGFVMTPRLLQPSGPAELTHLDAVRRIVARPPSLFVVVDAQKWEAASKEERGQLVTEIGRIAGEAGYSGVHARTVDGVVVGQWLKNGGARLITRPSGAT